MFNEKMIKKVSAYEKLKSKIDYICKRNTNFEEKTRYIEKYLNDISYDDFINIVINIGIIPESVVHDSTEEKFYAKVSDIILAKAFSELGLKSQIITERGDSADVYAESFYHNYSLVGDAKIFRLSRTAKNQKDFKVSGLNYWRKDNNYAVLCSPWYQYPTRSSQIYKEALDLNVSLFSWEYLVFMLQNKITESESVNLANIWNYSSTLSNTTINAHSKDRFIEKQNDFIENFDYKHSIIYTLSDIFGIQENKLINRADIEKQYWLSVIAEIKKYSREQAIEELLKEKKIDKKIQQIDKTVKGAKKIFDIAK